MHKVRHEDKYIVSGIGGTKWSPEVEVFWVKKSELKSKIAEMKKDSNVRQIDVEKGGFVDYLRGFTPMGEMDVIRAIRKDNPKRTEVVFKSRPKGFFGESKVLKVK